MATSTSVSSNLSTQNKNIKEKKDKFINIKNGVKILENYSNWNGYIKLYTEIENNFQINDIIYITYLHSSVTSDTFSLENSDTPYDKWSTGYKILYINKSKNEIVINRDYIDITSGKFLKNQYLSKVSVRGGTFTSGIIDGLVFYNASIYSGVTFTQGIFKGCNISDITFNDKYKNVKMLFTTNEFNTKFTRKKSTTATVFKKKRYYYNIIDNCRMIDCNIDNGKFDNSTLKSTNSNYITDGIFNTCIISGYTINGGSFFNSIIESNCTWNYGYWQNTGGTSDFRTSWSNGIWSSGMFYNKTWSGGTFNSGTFSASTWSNGIVNGGNFYHTTWMNGLVRNVNFYNSTWYNGIFNSGSFVDSTWSDGTFNKGTFLGSTFNNGSVNGGTITGSTILDGKIYNGKLIDLTISGGSFYKYYNLYDCTISGANFHQGTIENSNIINSNIYNGYFKDTSFSGGSITNGQFKDCDLENLTINHGNYKNCTADNVKFYNGIFTDGWYKNGYWYDGIWNGDGLVGTFESSTFIDGNFYGGYFSGDTSSPPDVGWNATWSGGTFHYGYWKGIYRTALPIYPYPKWKYSQQTSNTPVD